MSGLCPNNIPGKDNFYLRVRLLATSVESLNCLCLKTRSSYFSSSSLISFVRQHSPRTRELLPNSIFRKLRDTLNS
ncbi:unnamed protein product [Allacma fusca]|uniref:Uncharacterized protein n=1 Tax=Allacma fusca TaxID=39272 RepID=A0A8J2KNG2_9HEXA|nr:unnamed protein product [Allacma fusca]